MKRLLLVAASYLAAMVPAPTMAADVGVSITVGQPGFYGHIDIGDFPTPVVIYPQPVVIQPVPVGVVAAPMYLHVPPGHYKKWSKHCAQYNACGRPVYFVRDSWYNDVYVPRYREKYGKQERRGDHDRGEWRSRDDRDNGPPGRGKGRGQGKGRND